MADSADAGAGPSKAELKKAQKLAKKAEKAERAAKAKEKSAGKGASAAAKGAGAAGAGKEKKEKSIRLRSAFVNTTPVGEKKDLSGEIPKEYDPAAVEAAWYDWWEKQGYFHSSAAEKGQYKEKFVMVIPPPNVTGTLHMGHALTNSVEDVFCRYHRMLGKQVVWVPGCDHAGIATQVVVEKQLFKETGQTRHDLGRDKFLEKVWEWKEEKGGRIFEQLRRLGSSLDWERCAFTLDDARQRAVREAFFRMHADGLIYRENRMGNWCCTLKTAISDMEVDHKELEKRTPLNVPGYDRPIEFGIIEDFGYDVVNEDGSPLLDAEGQQVIVRISTTRLETMLGDTAVAIHPKDARYTHLHGKFVLHPYRQKRLPIVFDEELVNMDFGTACVKITPAHDPNDYQCGKRRNLPSINILHDDGVINENGLQFAGLKRYDAREAIRKDLQARGRHYGVRDNAMSIAVCSRSGDVIEPLIKPQWWVNCDDMCKKAAQAVRQGELEIIPQSREATWFHFMENSMPWCISRQLWWGHRINAWIVHRKGEPRPNGDNDSDWIVARTDEELRALAASKFGVDADELEYHQDPDVLDTWFSSGLFPFAVFGWPDETDDLAHFYPIELMETGEDILFFWVARMVMMGQQLTGKLPFRRVYLHTMVRDAHGRKMSKALGNVLDPVDVIEGVLLEDLHKKLYGGNLDPKEVAKAIEGQKKDFPDGISECGTDAMRLTLCTYTSQGTSINLNINQIIADRNFCNKMWNIVLFAMKFLPADYTPPQSGGEALSTRREDLWILHRLNHAIAEANAGLEGFKLGNSTLALRDFIIKELADVHLEALKPLMYNKDEGAEVAQAKAAALDTLYRCLDIMFRLLHPFMPFVTEELWQRLPHAASDPASIMIAPYPQPVQAWDTPALDQEMKVVQEIIKTSRRVRDDYKLTKERAPTFLVSDNPDDVAGLNLEAYAGTLESLGQMKSIAFAGPNDPRLGKSCIMSLVYGTTLQLYVDMKGLIDFDKEIEKLAAKLKALEREEQALEKRMAAPMYEEKVPQRVKEENVQKLAACKENQKQTREALENTQKMKEEDSKA